MPRPGDLPADRREHPRTGRVVLLPLVELLNILDVLPEALEDLPELLLRVQGGNLETCNNTCTPVRIRREGDFEEREKEEYLADNTEGKGIEGRQTLLGNGLKYSFPRGLDMRLADYQRQSSHDLLTLVLPNELKGRFSRGRPV